MENVKRKGGYVGMMMWGGGGHTRGARVRLSKKTHVNHTPTDYN